jgi:hypothetical protein
MPFFMETERNHISDNLSKVETQQLLIILEKHQAILGYCLQDLKGISPNLSTHRIPIHPDSTPSRQPQCRLNNTKREVVKKEVLKLLHAEIIYLIPNSEWVSPVQVVPKKVRTMCGSRTGGWSLPCGMSD